MNRFARALGAARGSALYNKMAQEAVDDRFVEAELCNPSALAPGVESDEGAKTLLECSSSARGEDRSKRSRRTIKSLTFSQEPREERASVTNGCQDTSPTLKGPRTTERVLGVPSVLLLERESRKGATRGRLYRQGGKGRGGRTIKTRLLRRRLFAESFTYRRERRYESASVGGRAAERPAEQSAT